MIIGNIKKRIKKSLHDFRRNETGAVSLPFVVLILIMTFAFCAFADEYKTTTTLTETESIFDLASVEALRYAVNEDEWAQGRLVVNVEKAKEKFVDILRENVKDGTAKNIQAYEIVDGMDGISITYNDTGLATGVHMAQPDENGNTVSSIDVESYFLSCVVNVTYQVRRDTDFVGRVTTTFYNIFSDEEQSADADNTEKDGYITVPVQVIGKITLQ